MVIQSDFYNKIKDFKKYIFIDTNNNKLNK